MFKKFIILIFVSITLFSDVSFGCLDQATRHLNPDNSLGGLVSKSAIVSKGAYISYNAKVCSFSVVEDKAKILDSSTISGHSWVKGNVIVSDQASISGSAYVFGNTNLPLRISGRASIRGGARIIGHSIISDSAIIEGAVTLDSSEARGTAHVCEKFVLKDLTIEDDYYCNDSVSSRANLKLTNLSSEKFNGFVDKIRIASDTILSMDQNVFNVELNGEQVDASKFSMTSKEFIIQGPFDFDEGENTLILNGRDHLGKKIESVFTFITGSGSIELDGQNLSNANVIVQYTYQGKAYKGNFEIESNSKLKLSGIPEGENIDVKVQGITSSFVFLEKFNTSSPPTLIRPLLFPQYVNNNTDFSNEGAGWTFNGPEENISFVSTAQGVKATIQFNSEDEIVIAKTFSIKSEKGLGIDLTGYSNLFTSERSIFDLEVIIASGNLRKLKVIDFDSITAEDIRPELFESFLDKGFSEYSIFIRTRPKSEKALFAPAFDVNGVRLRNKAIDFELKNFGVGNKKTVETNLPLTTPENKVDCSENLFNTSSDFYEVTKEDFNFISLGPIYEVSKVNSNRIYGKLNISGVVKNQITDIHLQIESDGDLLASAPLSFCANEVLKDENTSGDEFRYEFSQNLVQYLFDLPFSRNLFFINPSKISFRVKVDYIENKQSKIMYSIYNPVKADLLVIPELDSSYAIGHEDLYDSLKAEAARTGSDKWIQLSYADELESILRKFSGFWKINDISRLNGGTWYKHAEHRDGTDADISYTDFNNKKFAGFGDNDVTWVYFLSKVDNFLKEIRAYYPKIWNIYIERSKTTASKFFLDRKFENRCYQNRFINFAAKQRHNSLLRDIPPHSDHIHLSFRWLNASGLPDSLDSSVEESEKYDLDNFIFELNTSSGFQLSVKPIGSFPNMKAFVRLQDIQGFEGIPIEVFFAQWPDVLGKRIENSSLKPTHLENLRFLYLAIVQPSGACVERSVVIDLQKMKIKNKNSIRWTFFKKDKTLTPVVL